MLNQYLFGEHLVTASVFARLKVKEIKPRLMVKLYLKNQFPLDHQS